MASVTEKRWEVARYELPFKARANPFAPPNTVAKARLADGPAVDTADVQLMGLMHDGSGPMAAVVVLGKQRLVRAGACMGPSGNAGGLCVRQIRESDIVVEQGRRQWIVQLRRPTGSNSAGQSTTGARTTVGDRPRIGR
jgi:hypothetical protein